MKKVSVVFILLAIIAVTAPHALIFARAGGGEAFGGGSFGGGSYSGGSFGGGGYGGLYFLPFFFTDGGGSSWVFVFIFVIIFLIPFFARRFGPTNTGNRQFWMPQQPVPQNADLSQIASNDSGFSKERFIDFVETTFFAIQDAWMRKDLLPVRGLMSDAQFQRFMVQIQDMERRHITNVVDQIAVREVKIVKANRDARYETIACAITASMIDYKEDDGTGKIVAGSQSVPTQFTEYWTFIRSTGTKTPETSSVVTKKCPNCGAPLDINESGQCKYCKASVISGAFDWVLSNISQTFV